MPARTPAQVAQTWTSAPSSQDRATDGVRPTRIFDLKNDTRGAHQRFPHCPVKGSSDSGGEQPGGRSPRNRRRRFKLEV